MSVERQTDTSKNESAMKPATDDKRRDTTRDRPSRLDGALGNTTRAHLMGRAEGGRELPAGLRAQLEQALGTSLGDVRVHDDSTARSAAEVVDAQAFTRGRDIYWGPTAPGVGSPAAEALLAHEVMHVEQQRRAASIEARVSTPAEATEAEAHGEAARALGGQHAAVARGGSVAGVQRQPKGKGGLSVEKTADITREDAQRVLHGFLQRVLSTAPQADLRKSGVVRTALMTLSQKAGGSAMYIDIDRFLSEVPNDAAEISARFAKRLPERVDPAALEAVNKLTSKDTPPSKAGRVGAMIKRTAPGDPDPSRIPPGQTDPAKEADRAFELTQRMSGQPDPTKVGPFSVDVWRVGSIFGGLGGALRGDPQRTPQPEARPSGGVDAAVQKIKPDALTPTEARGTAQAEEFDVAQRFARDVATRIDIALQQGRDTVSLQLGYNFTAVRDRAALRAAVEAIIATIREAFPDKAAKVVNVDVKIGGVLLTRGRVR